MQADLVALMLSDGALAALVAGRIHWDRQPATVSGRPYINLTLVSDVRLYHFRGVAQLRQPRVQVDIWAESAASRHAVASASEALLSGYRGITGQTDFRGIFQAAVRESTGDTAAGERALFRHSADYIVNWRPKEG